MTSKTWLSHPGGDKRSLFSTGIKLTPIEAKTKTCTSNIADKNITINVFVNNLLFFLRRSDNSKPFNWHIIRGTMRPAPIAKSIVVIIEFLNGSIKKPTKLLEFKKTRLYRTK